MTKDAYFEMCEMLGNDPVEDEIPLEIDDFPLEVQVAFSVYGNLQDNWDTMNGNYLGKIKYNLTEVFSLLGVEQEDYREIFTLVSLIDSVRIEAIKSRPTQPA